MGAVGSNSFSADTSYSGEYEREPEVTYETFEGNSNIDNIEWFREHGGLFDNDAASMDELDAVVDYTGSTYGGINHYQYSMSWEDMKESDDNSVRYYMNKIMHLHNALSKATLTQGIQVNRQADFRIFGKKQMTMDEISKFLDKTNGIVQNDGFMSASTYRNGVSVDGSGLILHFKIPPSTGAGAYIGNVSHVKGEMEYLINNNSVWQFDKGSMYKDSQGRVHITATWLGQTASQTISPTFKKPRVSKNK